MYDEVVNEPVPSEFLDLIRQSDLAFKRKLRSGRLLRPF
jgi:hypothetical protein